MISPKDAIANHLQEDDTAYSDPDEASSAAQRILDALLHAGYVPYRFQEQMESAIDRGIASAQMQR